MRGASRFRGALRRRGRQLVASVLCAASFLSGQLVWGGDPPGQSALARVLAPVPQQQLAPVVSAPAQFAPVMSPPVLSAPVMSAPVMSAPVQPAPVKPAPVQSAPQTVLNQYVQAAQDVVGQGSGFGVQGSGAVGHALRGVPGSAGKALTPAAVLPIDNPTIISNPMINNPVVIMNPMMNNPAIILNPTITNPAVITNPTIDNPASDDALPRIITPAQARPLRSQEPEAGNQEPEARDQEPGAVGNALRGVPEAAVSQQGPKLVEARPLELEQSTKAGGRNATEGVPDRSTDPGLAPIVPASAAPPRPAARSRESGVGSQESAAAPWMQDIRAVIERTEHTTTRDARNATEGVPYSAPPLSNPKSKIQSPKFPATPAQFTRDADADDDAALFTAQPAAPAPAAPAISPLPAGSPFEAIGESGTVTVRVGRSLLMRTKVDIYRTAVVEESVCDIVQFTPREISLIGRAAGTTHITFWFDDPGQPPLTYLVKVEPDPAVISQIEDKFQMLEDLVNEQFPDSKIKLVVLADKLLLKGQAKDAEEAAQILTIVRTQGQALGAYSGTTGLPGVADAAATGVIPAAAAGALANQPSYQIVNMLRVPGVQQVALRVKIAELNRSAARGFGVNVAANIDFGDSQLLLASLLNTNLGGVPGSGTSVIANISGDDASIGIRYLQSHGVIRLLSEPTLVTLSGRPATFVAGGEFAVPTVVGSVGLNAVTTDFRAFGAIISFLPTVIDKDRIRLQVAPEFSQINSDLTVGGTPGLNVRSATTTVEMREGQTLAIAGLLEDNYKATNVGDLPFLAKIFGRRDASRNETELIILVTPELVHPLEPEEVPPLPGFDVTEPTNAEFFLCGDIEGHPTREYRSTVWPRLRKRYGGPAMTSGPFGHGQ